MTNFSSTEAGKKLIEEVLDDDRRHFQLIKLLPEILDSAFSQGKQAGHNCCEVNSVECQEHWKQAGREEYENEWFRGDAIRIAVEKGRQLERVRIGNIILELIKEKNEID